MDRHIQNMPIWVCFVTSVPPYCGLPITLNPSGAASDTIAVYEFLGNWGALSFKSRTSTVTVAVDDKRPAGSLASTRSRNFRSLAFS